MNSNKKTKWIILILLTAVIGGLLIVALDNVSSESPFDIMSLDRSVLGILTVFLVIVLILLAALLCVMIFGKNEGDTIRANIIAENVSGSSQKPETPEEPEIPDTPEEPEEVA